MFNFFASFIQIISHFSSGEKAFISNRKAQRLFKERFTKAFTFHHKLRFLHHFQYFTFIPVILHFIPIPIPIAIGIIGTIFLLFHHKLTLPHHAAIAVNHGNIHARRPG